MGAISRIIEFLADFEPDIATEVFPTEPDFLDDVQSEGANLDSVTAVAPVCVYYAERAGNINDGGAADNWGFGNGSNDGGITLPYDFDLVSLSLHIRTFPAGRTLGVSVINRLTNTVVPGTEIVTTGPVDNATAIVNFDPVIQLNAGDVFGFRTTTQSGGAGIANGRVAAWLQRRV